MGQVSIITSLHKELPHYWLETAESVLEVANHHTVTWDVQWCVHLNGLEDAEFIGSDAYQTAKHLIHLSSTADNVGYATACNLALTNAEGDLVGFVKEGDRLRPQEWIELVDELYGDPALGWVAGRSRDIDSFGNPIDEEFFLEPGLVAAGELVESNLNRAWWPWGWPWCGAAAVVRRQLIESVGGWAAIPWAEDVSMWLGITAISQGLHVDKVVYDWRKQEEHWQQDGQRALGYDGALRATNRRAAALHALYNPETPE